MSEATPEASGRGLDWSPILAGSLASEALEAVRVIADAVRTPPPGVRPDGDGEAAAEAASLAAGRAGQAVLYAYLAKAGLAAADAAEPFLDEATGAVSKIRMSPSFYGGFTGIAWATAHLTHASRADVEDAHQEIDAALRTLLTRSPWQDDYDLVNGLVGLGVYALERLPGAGARTLLSLVVERLAETAERTDSGITWRTRPELLPEHQRKECPEGYYNLGLAHGVPGAVALVGGICAAGIGGVRARGLLEDAIGWLLAQKLSPTAGSGFPAWIAPGQAARPTRSAWCYGDPGIAAALLCAARSVGSGAWRQEALEIASRTAARPPDQAGVRDAGLCHGAAGLAHVFNRLYQATGEPRLADAARFWFERTLHMRKPGAGPSGYRAAHPRPDGAIDWVEESGLLTGAAGIALALLAAITTVEPAWDRILLLTCAPLQAGRASE